MDPLNTPVAFVSLKNGIYIIKIESKAADPRSLYELKKARWGDRQERLDFKSTRASIEVAES